MSKRLFFGLAPPHEVGQQLYQVALQLPHAGSTHRQENLHMTLAFLGAVTQEQAIRMQTAAGALSARPFTLKIDTIGSFPRARVLWLGPSNPPQALTNLQAELARRLRAACPELAVWEREHGQYRPHVTIGRRFKQSLPELTFAPICWPVMDFCLFASESSENGSNYRVLQRWPLDG
ncbi:MAG: RNA 2',3'-cyclic phosphodiesterase [Thiotrichales bacterium]